jgi:hypothetical protein
MSRSSSSAFWNVVSPTDREPIASPSYSDVEHSIDGDRIGASANVDLTLSPSTVGSSFRHDDDDEEVERSTFEMSGDDENAPSHSTPASSSNESDEVSSIGRDSSFSHSSEGAEFSESGVSFSDSNDED